MIKRDSLALRHNKRIEIVKVKVYDDDNERFARAEA